MGERKREREGEIQQQIEANCNAPPQNDVTRGGAAAADLATLISAGPAMEE